MSIGSFAAGSLIFIGKSTYKAAVRTALMPRWPRLTPTRQRTLSSLRPGVQQRWQKRWREHHPQHRLQKSQHR